MHFEFDLSAQGAVRHDVGMLRRLSSAKWNLLCPCKGASERLGIETESRLSAHEHMKIRAGCLLSTRLRIAQHHRFKCSCSSLCCTSTMDPSMQATTHLASQDMSCMLLTLPRISGPAFASSSRLRCTRMAGRKYTGRYTGRARI